jgi:hypothetical protein
MERFNPLLLVKHPDARGPLEISGEFMTNADIPFLVTKEIENPLNPYTGNPITQKSKKKPLYIVEGISFQPRQHGPYNFNLTGICEFLGGDIFSASSWGPWRNSMIEHPETMK